MLRQQAANVHHTIPGSTYLVAAKKASRTGLFAFWRCFASFMYVTGWRGPLNLTGAGLEREHKGQVEAGDPDM
jgi:hypothetical protein